DVVTEIAAFFKKRLQELMNVGIPSERVVLDPGIGLGKTTEHNLEIIGRLGAFQQLGRPICLGVSRKGLLAKALGGSIRQRLVGSLAAISYALARQTAQIVRVHDVEETCEVVRMLEAIRSHAAE